MNAARPAEPPRRGEGERIVKNKKDKKDKKAPQGARCPLHKDYAGVYPPRWKAEAACSCWLIYSSKYVKGPRALA